MNKKINFIIIAISVFVVVSGLFLLYKNFTFYKEGTKTEAIISKIGEPDLCANLGQCKFGRSISLNINKIGISETQEVSTITAISGMFAVGNKINVVYRQKLVNALQIEIFGNSPKPILFEVKIYSWHYWGYPILLIICGPLFYLVVKRINKKEDTTEVKIV